MFLSVIVSMYDVTARFLGVNQFLFHSFLRAVAFFNAFSSFTSFPYHVVSFMSCFLNRFLKFRAL